MGDLPELGTVWQPREDSIPPRLIRRPGVVVGVRAEPSVMLQHADGSQSTVGLSVLHRDLEPADDLTNIVPDELLRLELARRGQPTPAQTVAPFRQQDIEPYRRVMREAVAEMTGRMPKAGAVCPDCLGHGEVTDCGAPIPCPTCDWEPVECSTCAGAGTIQEAVDG